MKNFIKTLEELDTKDTLFKKDKKSVFLLSGQSNFNHSELSCEQKSLLLLIAKYGYSPILTGFPCNQKYDFQNCERAKILSASYRNSRQFVLTTFNVEYQKIIAKHIQAVFDLSDDIIIICQSSGLHMLNKAIPYLEIDTASKIKIIALGPVVYGKFCDHRFRLYVIKGEKDWLTNNLDSHSPDYLIKWGHLDYCASNEVFEYINEILKNEKN